MPFFGLVPCGDAGLGERASETDPLRRLVDRNPFTVASLSLFLDRRSCPSISSSPPSAPLSRSREVALESEALSPFARTKNAPVSGNDRELTVLPTAAYGALPVFRVYAWGVRLLDPGPPADPTPELRGEVEVISWCGRKCRFKFCNVRLAADVEAPEFAGLPTGVLLPDVEAGLSNPFHRLHGGVCPLEADAASSREVLGSTDDRN